MAALDFPSSPSIGTIYPNPAVAGQPQYTWDGEKWTSGTVAVVGAVRFDTAQGLTANQQAQARSNTGVTKKSYIVNGAMQISQENGATAGTTPPYYPVDQFNSANTNSGSISAAQVASGTPGGSPNRFRYTMTAADATVGAGDWAGIQQMLEGVRIADLRFGSAAAKSIVLQFGVKAPAGTYCVSFRNGSGPPNRTYVAEYVIAAGEANTDVVKTVTFAGDTVGTWNTDNTIGINLTWVLCGGSTFQTPAGAWTAGNFFCSANQFNFPGTNGNVFELFDVSLTEGNVAPPFQVPDFGSELALCKRYFQIFTNNTPNGDTSFANGIVTSATAYDRVALVSPVMMRAIPTLSLSGSSWVYDGSVLANVVNTIAANLSGMDVLAFSGTTTGAAMVLGRPACFVFVSGSGGTLKANARL